MVTQPQTMTENTTPRTFVRPDDTATITCPACQLVKTLSVGQFRGNRHTISVRCACGHRFSVALDFRRFYRKKTTLAGIYDTQALDSIDNKERRTQLSGVYTMQAPAFGSGVMQITNISSGGLQFVTTYDHTIELGQKARVNFTLDDRNHTELTKNVIVQSVNDRVIGCRFAEGEYVEQALRFYLFP